MSNQMVTQMTNLVSWAALFGGIYFVMLSPTLAGDGTINVREYPSVQQGAAADGETDDSAALRAGMEAGMEEGKEVHIPAGTYLLKDAIRMNVESDLTVTGDGE